MSRSRLRFLALGTALTIVSVILIALHGWMIFLIESATTSYQAEFLKPYSIVPLIAAIISGCFGVLSFVLWGIGTAMDQHRM